MTRLRALLIVAACGLAVACGDESPPDAGLPPEAEEMFFGRTGRQWGYDIWQESVQGERAILDELLSHGPEAAPLILGIDSHRARQTGVELIAPEAYKLGPDAVPVFAEGLSSDDAARRVAAAAAFVWFGDDALAAKEDLARAIETGVREEDHNLVAFSRVSLVCMGADAGDAVLPLARKRETRAVALDILAGWDLLGWRWLEELADGEDTKLAAAAADRLAELRSAGIRRDRLDTAARLRAPAVILELPLREAIFLDEEEARDLRLESLDAGAALERLIRIVEFEKRGREKRLAANVLARYERLAAPALPGLIEMLSDRDFQTRRAAIGAIGMIGPPAGDAVPELMRVLENDIPNERLDAAWALGQIGPEAQDAWPLLMRLWELRGPDPQLKHESGNRMHTAVVALGNIDPERAMTELGGSLDDPQWPVRRSVLEAYLIAGPRSYLRLAEALHGDSLRARRAAGLALAWLAEDDFDAWDILATAPGDDPILAPLVREARSKTGR